MAEGILIQEKGLEELEREITCGICQEHYTEPKVLPCLHYYCKKCILRLSLRTGTGEPFSCPECRYEATLPDGGVDELKTAFFVNRIKTTISTMERAHGKVEVKCELCSDYGGKAEVFCRQCAMFICKDCIKQHKKLKILQTHEVVSLEDLKQGQAKQMVVREDHAPMKCMDHDEPLVIYCFDCDMLICRDCTMKDHRDHNFEFCKKAAATTKSNLLEKLDPLKTQSSSLSRAVEEVRTTKQELEAQRDAVANTIKNSFKELRDILDNREQELLGEADGLVQEKIDRLSVQEKTLSLASAEVQSVVDYTEQCVRHCTDNEVMSMHAEIRRQIKRKVEEHSKSGSNLEPVDEVDIGVDVRCAEALQQLCQKEANIMKQPIDLTKTTVTMEDMAEEEVTKISKATLVTRLSNARITRRKCEVSSYLKSLYSGVITECKVYQNVTDSGVYFIQYTPSVRGRHELTISVDGQQVAGSPYSVFISIPPTLLGKPVKVLKDFPKAAGITVNSLGEILVSNYHGSIVKVNKEGEKLKLLSQSEVENLRKIAVDDDDNVYCICEPDHKVLKCDKNGGNIRVQDVKWVNKGQRGLEIVGEEVMICEINNNGTIMVYDKELNYVRQIQHKDGGHFLALSSDGCGNLYCADWSNSCIQVISNNGVFQHSFGCDRNGVQKVSNSWGLCVFGRYVYVVNTGSGSVSVFTTDGDYITSFGQFGNKEGNFKWPHSICVDKDGFVYITDYESNKVLCF